MPPVMLPLVDVCASTRLSYAVLWRQLLTGELSGAKIGRRWFVDQSAVRALEKRLAGTVAGQK